MKAKFRQTRDGIELANVDNLIEVVDYSEDDEIGIYTENESSPEHGLGTEVTFPRAEIIEFLKEVVKRYG